MERLTIIEHDMAHAMHPRCFEAITRGSCIARLEIWIDQRLPELEAHPPRLSVHPRVGEAILLERQAQDGWHVIVRIRGQVVREASYGPFTDAARDFVSFASRDGDQWSEYEPARRPGEQETVRGSQIIAWVNTVTYRLAVAQQRQLAVTLAVVAAQDALREGDVERALAGLAGAANDSGALPLPAGLPSGLLDPLRELGQLLVIVEDEDPPGYVTALAAQARKVVAAAGLDLTVMTRLARPEDEPADDDTLAA